jgi:hypothetical protein
MFALAVWLPVFFSFFLDLLEHFFGGFDCDLAVFSVA